MRVAVLGAGVVGVCAAWYLAEAGHEVTVIERQGGPALETSWGNGGVIHASEVEPWSAPGMPRKILGWIGREDAPLLLRPSALPFMWRWGFQFARNCSPARFKANALANLDLALLSLRLVQDLQASLGIDYDRETRGVLKIFRDPAALDVAEASCRMMEPHGLSYRRLMADEAVALEPALRDTGPTLAGALHFARDEVGDCNKFTAGLAAAAGARGVAFRFHASAERAVREGGRLVGVATSQGVVPCDAAVVALGSFAAPFLRRHGVRVPIYPVKGVSITLRREGWNDAPSMPVIDDSKLFGLVPIGDRMRISGSAEIARFDATPASARARAILDSACLTFPSLRDHHDPARSRVWSGLRPVTPSGTPIIGPTALQGLWINAGHGHLGWTLAAASGRTLARLMSGHAAEVAPETVTAVVAGTR